MLIWHFVYKLLAQNPGEGFGFTETSAGGILQELKESLTQGSHWPWEEEPLQERNGPQAQGRAPASLLGEGEQERAWNCLNFLGNKRYRLQHLYICNPAPPSSSSSFQLARVLLKTLTDSWYLWNVERGSASQLLLNFWAVQMDPHCWRQKGGCLQNGREGLLSNQVLLGGSFPGVGRRSGGWQFLAWRWCSLSWFKSHQSRKKGAPRVPISKFSGYRRCGKHGGKIVCSSAWKGRFFNFFFFLNQYFIFLADLFFTIWGEMSENVLAVAEGQGRIYP